MWKYILLWFLLLGTVKCDMFSSYYGNYLPLAGYVSACLSSCSECCVTQANVSLGQPDKFVLIKLMFDSSSLSRCKAISSSYSTDFSFTKILSDGSIQTIGMLGGFTVPPQVEFDFSSNVFVYNSGCRTSLYLASKDNTSDSSGIVMNIALFVAGLLVLMMI